VNRTTAAFIVTAAHGLVTLSAHAGPCSNEIAQFEQAVRESSGNPNAGAVATQSIAAQLDRQPTPDSLKRAEAQAQRAFKATVARAKKLDDKDDRAGCAKALAKAKAMYNLQ
jgi:hypothetical protein